MAQDFLDTQYSSLIVGVIVDYGLTLGDLIGVLYQFFKKLGIEKLRFKPAYNPYTEPSLEIFSYHEGNSFIHAFAHSLMQSLIHKYITHSFIHSLIHSFIHSLTHSFVHSFFSSFTYSSIHSLIYSLTHSFIYSFINSFLCSLFPPRIH